MLGSATLDMVIGMVFVFLLLSLVVSAVREAIEARLQDRAKLLGRGIKELLGGDPEGAQAVPGSTSSAMVERFYSHPLIAALYSGPFDKKLLTYKRNTFGFWVLKYIGSFLFRRTRMPSYIPARTAALALLDLARTGQLAGGTPATTTAGGAVNLADVRAALQAQSDSKVARALLAILAQAGDDTEAGVAAIQNWYDGAMDRVAGWFKRETQQILFVLGLLVAIGMNVDAILLLKYLTTNEQGREGLVKVAMAAAEKEDLSEKVGALRAASTAPPKAEERPADDSKAAQEAAVHKAGELVKAADAKVADAVRDVVDLNLPIGWNRSRWNEFLAAQDRFGWTLLGWLVTAFGLSFGAPFWFDLLNRLMVIRSTVKPHEKSQEESA